MLSCPFCGQDFADSGLNAGRCPSCGVVLSWEDDQANEQVVSELMAATENSVVTPQSGKDDESTSAPEPSREPAGSAPSPQSTVTTRSKSDTKSATDTPKSKQRQLSPEEVHRVSVMWQESIESEAITSPRMTIKSDSGSSNSTSKLVIRPRAIRHTSEPEVGIRDDYELLDIIGQGGVGVVYAARQASIDRTVAVKMLHDEASQDAVQREKFLSEAVVTGDLDHPNIVPIYDLGTDRKGALFYSMKRVKGTPWSDVLLDKSRGENLDILMKVADAIAFSHDRGVVHRDLKPENIMLGDYGEVLVMDWGIALSTELFVKAGSISQSASMGGTPAYMAPEMATGPLEAIGPLSDVYLLGAILYEIITGEAPHTGRSVEECLLAAARNEIVPTRETGELVKIALKAMSLDPLERHSSVQDFQQSIRDYQSHSESLTLAQRASEDLQEAQRTGNYEDFSRAVFGFEEAVALWDGNHKARRSLSSAKLSYAAIALDNADYDLGLSLLDPENPKHKSTYEKLELGRRERNMRQRRLKNFRYLVAVLILALFAGGSVAMTVILREKNAAVAAQRTAEAKEREADNERINANNAQSLAKKEAENARQQLKNTILAKRNTEEQKANALAASTREAVARYATQVRIALDELRTNAFGAAVDTLAELERDPLARYRHWETGRLAFICREGSQAVALDNRVPLSSVAVSQDRQTRCVATSQGELYVWTAADQNVQKLTVTGTLHDLICLQNGQRLVAVGGVEQQGVVWLWELKADGQYELTQQATLHRGPILSATCSQDGRWLATGGADSRALLVSLPELEVQQTFLGHLDQVLCVDLSRTQSSAPPRWVVTGSLDETARVWDVETGQVVQRFEEHDSSVTAVRFSDQDTGSTEGRSYVASAGSDGRILIWERRPDANYRQNFVSRVESRLKGEGNAQPQARVLEGHEDRVRALAFSEQGQILVSASDDNTLRVWDAQHGLTDPAPASNDLAELRLQAQIADLQRGELKRLRGHTGRVNDCAIVPHTTQLLSVGFDGRLLQWNYATYQEARVFREPGKQIASAQLSLDGQAIVASLRDGTARVFDVEDSERVGQVREGHQYLATQGFLLPNRRHLLTIAGDNTTRIWDLHTQGEAFHLENTGRRAIAAVTPDGHWLLTTTNDLQIAVWDLRTRQQTTVLPTVATDLRAEAQEFSPERREALESQLPSITSLDVNSKGNRLAAGDSRGNLLVYDLEQGTRIGNRQGHAQSVQTLRFLPGSDVLVSASEDGTVAQWDGESLEEVNRPRILHAGPVRAMDLHGATRTLVTSSRLPDERQQLQLWSLDSRTQPLATYAFSNQDTLVQSLGFSESGERVLVTLADKNRKSLSEWTPARPPAEALSPVWSRSLSSLVVQADYLNEPTEAILTVGGKGAVIFARSGEALKEFRPDSELRQATLNDQGTQLLTLAEKRVKLWQRDRQANSPDAPGWRVHLRLRQLDNRSLVRVYFVADDTQILAVEAAGEVALWSAVDGSPIPEGTVCRHDHPLVAAALSRNKVWMFTADAQGTLRITHLPSRETYDLPTDSSQAGTVQSADISDDGRWAVVGLSDANIQVWDLSLRQNVAELKGHSGPVTAVSLSPDRNRVASGADDGKVKIWDLTTIRATGKGSSNANEIMELPQHDGPLLTVQFSSLGDRLLTATTTGANIWQATALAPSFELKQRELIRVNQASSTQPIAPHAIVREPTATNYEGYRFRVTISNLAETQHNVEESIKVVNSESLVVVEDEVRYCTPGESNWEVIGHLQREDASQGLSVQLTDKCRSESLEAMLRGLAYVTTSAIGEDLLRSVELLLIAPDASRLSPQRFQDQRTILLVASDEALEALGQEEAQNEAPVPATD